MKTEPGTTHGAMFAVAAIALALLPRPATAGNWSVYSVSELIGAINAANQAGGTNTITLARGKTFTLTAVNSTINGPTGLPVIAANNNLTIRGNGATLARTTTPDTPAFRLFVVASGASLTLENLAIAHGKMVAPARMNAFGGAILNKSGGTLAVSHTMFVGNEAMGGDGGGRPGGWGVGGAIYSEGTANLEHSTFRGNRAVGGAGGLGANGGDGIGGAYSVGSAVIFGLEDTSSAALDGGSLVEGNRAIGGASGPGSSGGHGNGGGVAVLAGNASVTDSGLAGNKAAGGAGFNGGTGRGGGLYNVGVASLTRSGVTGNKGEGGLAQGGGVFNDGTIVVDALTRLLGNKPDGCFGCP